MFAVKNCQNLSKILQNFTAQKMTILGKKSLIYSKNGKSKNALKFLQFV